MTAARDKVSKIRIVGKLWRGDVNSAHKVYLTVRKRGKRNKEEYESSIRQGSGLGSYQNTAKDMLIQLGLFPEHMSKHSVRYIFGHEDDIDYSEEYEFVPRKKDL